MTRKPVERIASPAVARPAGHYSHAVAHGDLIFVSGQLPIRPDGTPTADLPFEDQARQALANVLAILETAGAGPHDVLKVTVYVVGVRHWPSFDRLYGEAFGDARPARAVVPVPELHYGHLVEIEAVAVRPAAER